MNLMNPFSANNKIGHPNLLYFADIPDIRYIKAPNR